MIEVSYYPPKDILPYGLFKHLAMDLTILVFPTPGGPYKRRTLAKNKGRSTFKLTFDFANCNELKDSLFDFLHSVMIFIENI